MEPGSRLSAAEPITERRALLIALGNGLRRDDGVAQRVLDLLPNRSGISRETQLQLMPELAQGLAGFDPVVFIDADMEAVEAILEPVGQLPSGTAFTHGGDPAALVLLARQLFGFSGRAFLCRIPAEDFGSGEGLSEKASAAAHAAARKIEELLA